MAKQEGVILRVNLRKSIDAAMAELSDEQVRQMILNSWLIDN